LGVGVIFVEGTSLDHSGRAQKKASSWDEAFWLFGGDGVTLIRLLTN